MLHQNKLRAIGLLSQGHDTSSVAQTIGYARQTLCRWKAEPEFQTELERQTGDIMANMHIQVQTTAKTLVEGGLESAQQLRYMIGEASVKPQDRRLSAQCLLKYASRFWDLMGYNVDAKSPRKLLCDEFGKSLDESLPKIEDPKPADRHTRTDAERDPVQRHYEAGIKPPWVVDWEYNQIHDDGRPKGKEDYFHRESMLAGIPEEAMKFVKQSLHQGDLNSEHDVFKAVQKYHAAKISAPLPEPQQEAATPRAKPKRKRKAWKRSATTLRCKPEANRTPIAAGTQRNPTETRAALRASESEDAALRVSDPSISTQDAHDPG